MSFYRNHHSTAPASLAAALWLIATAALAGSVNEIDGLAIKGYDPVAYFTDKRPVAGSGAFTAIHDGATFHFVSAANRDAFVADPAKYAPQYGGFCAYGTARGYKAGIDPAAFTIVDGRLYLNYDTEVRPTWAEDIPGYLKKADTAWPEVEKTDKVYR